MNEITTKVYPMVSQYEQLTCSFCHRNVEGKGYSGDIQGFQDLFVYCSPECAELHADVYPPAQDIEQSNEGDF